MRDAVAARVDHFHLPTGRVVPQRRAAPIRRDDLGHAPIGVVAELGDAVVVGASVVAAQHRDARAAPTDVVRQRRDDTVGVDHLERPPRPIAARHLLRVACGVGDRPQVALAPGARGRLCGAVRRVGHAIGIARDVCHVGARAVLGGQQAGQWAAACGDVRGLAVRPDRGRTGAVGAADGGRRALASAVVGR